MSGAVFEGCLANTHLGTLCLLPATVLAIGAPIVVTGLSVVSGT